VDGRPEAIDGGGDGVTRARPLDRALLRAVLLVLGFATVYAAWRAFGPAPDDLTAPDRGDVVTLAKGEEVDLAANTVAGKYTVYDFYADWCPPCRALDTDLRAMAARHENVAIRRIDIVDWTTPVVRQHGLVSLPFIVLFGPDGKEIARGDEAFLRVGELFGDVRYQ
jgi:thioredoxin 1